MALRTIARSRLSNARLGLLSTKDGVLETPAFVAVATNAALKSVDIRDVPGLDAIFVNAYHLLLHPGVDVIGSAGGIHRFMGMNEKVVMSDSGGFQIFSLKYGTVHEELSPSLKMKSKAKRYRKDHASSNVKVEESGVVFRSYRDGTKLHLSPERSVSAQKEIGSSIIMPLDELPPYHTSPSQLETSLERTHRWMARSLDTHLQSPRGQLCYGIVHGGSVKSLRKKSVDFCVAQAFDGFAVGGALGRDAEELLNIIRFVMDDADNGGCGLRNVALRTGKPVHVLGIADPWNMRRLIALGVDTFDGCFITKISRHGTMLAGDYRNPSRILLKSGRYKHVHARLEGCTCSTCTENTISYLHHLVRSHEPLAHTLLSIHNLTYVTRMMRSIREEIKQGIF